MRPKDGFPSLYVCMYVYVWKRRPPFEVAIRLGVAPRCPRGTLLLLLNIHTVHSFIHFFLLCCCCCLHLSRATSIGDFFTKKLDYEAKWRLLWYYNFFFFLVANENLNWQFQQWLFWCGFSGTRLKEFHTHRFRCSAMFMNGFSMMDRLSSCHFRVVEMFLVLAF